MRQKDKRVRIDSTAVQGSESFVIVKSPSWGLLRKAQRLTMTTDGSDPGTVGVEFAEELVRESVIAWNWTDDNDEPLPTPANDKSVVDRLTAEEVGFLVEKITGMVSGSTGN